MSAFDKLNDVGMPKLATQLKLTQGRMRSYGPCPICKAEKRGADDKRLPIGITPNEKGWQCHKCKTTGNLTDILCYVLVGCRYSDTDSHQKGIVLNWLKEFGYAKEDFKPEKKILSLDVKLNKKDKIVPVDMTSDFRWGEDLWKRYKQNLNENEGQKALSYLKNQRCLSPEVIDLHDLGCMVDSKNQPWVVIPLKDNDGEVINMKFRSVPPQKKKYRNCAGRPLPLFGSNLLTSNKEEFVIVVEGELDVIAMSDYGYKTNCVSSPAGASAKWKDDWLNVLEPYKGFYLWYDNDHVGDSGADDLAKKLGTYRCFRIKTPLKDAGECLQKGMNQQQIKDVISKKVSSYINTTFKRVCDYRDDIEQLILNPVSLRGLSTGSNKLDPLVGGLRAGLWVVSGDTGHGKTTFLTWMLWEQALRHVPVMITSFEQRPIGTVQKLLRSQIGNDFTKVSAERRKEALNILGTLPIHILDHYGELETEKVIEAIRFCVRRHDVKVALVDHLGFLARANEIRDERQSIEYVIRE